MCLSGPSEACNNFVPNRAWMERSGNMCWGMGAMQIVPCVNCGQKKLYHRIWDDLEDYEDSGI